MTEMERLLACCALWVDGKERFDARAGLALAAPRS
jgi:hypothetical protein